jgi:hypothetical protein
VPPIAPTDEVATLEPLNHVFPPFPESAPAEPIPIEIELPMVNVKFDIAEYPPPPPPPPAPLVVAVAPPPPAAITSIVLFVLSQSFGTVQVVPLVRKTILFAIAIQIVY